MKKYCIGLDIGGTKCAVSLGQITDGQVELLGKRKFATAKGDPQAVLEAFCREIELVLQDTALTKEQISAIGISCGGPLDSRRGIILSPPNLPGWDRIEIVSYFEEKTGIRTYLQNDANACAAAEWKYGAGRGTQNMIFLTFGTGLGAGLILDGHLYSGTSDMAGEIGHVRLAEDGPIGYGKAGSAEGFCSGGGIAQIGRHRVLEQVAQGKTPRILEVAGSVDQITAKVIGDLAEQEQDPLSIQIYEECGTRLGQTLSILVDILNPERIVLGGVFMRSADLLRPSLERVMRRETLAYANDVCTVVPAGLGETVGDYAALAVADQN